MKIESHRPVRNIRMEGRACLSLGESMMLADR
jgi:hypothetical protein